MTIMSKPLWSDDFFGIALNPQYAPVVSGTGSIKMSSNPNLDGVVELGTVSSGAGNARLRFGEEPGTGASDQRNWNASNNIVHEARVFWNNNTYMQATVGFVGNPDPTYVIAAIYKVTGNTPGTWTFQIANSGQTTQNINTGFTHTPGTWTTFRIQTTNTNPLTATLYINDNQVATYSGSAVPNSNLAHEFQVWNKLISGSNYSQVTMWVDYLYLTQNR